MRKAAAAEAAAAAVKEIEEKRKVLPYTSNPTPRPKLTRFVNIIHQRGSNVLI